MIWLLQDFDLLSVVLRALSLSLEALTVGGVIFLLVVATRRTAEHEARLAVRYLTSWFALGLAMVQMLSGVENCLTLITSGVPFRSVVSANFFEADCLLLTSTLLLAVILCFWKDALVLPVIASGVLVYASVSLSHANSQLEHRGLLLLLTAAHHLGSAAWIGGMPSLLVAMRRTKDPMRVHVLAARFSAMSLVSVAVLVLAGIGMSYFYVASWQGLYGTSYGVMLLAKLYLLTLALVLGASNYFLVRRTRQDAAPVLIRLRRFSEVEIGLIFTAIIAAASMSAQTPAKDMGVYQVTRAEIAQRMTWRWPTLNSPSLAQISKAAPLKVHLESEAYSGGKDNDAMDRAWSEYNHQWAGLIVLAAGILALIAEFPHQRWARNWPLLFFALAVFIVLRADTDAWPLGPRPFWASFAESDVLEHRVFAALIVAFAIFEWAVETDRLKMQWPALVFPGICALGGALLLTHMHSFGADEKNEMLVGLNHTAIAVLGVTAGWSRWLQVRLPDRKVTRITAWIWPVCLILVAVVLMDYRES
jgi:putative copper resistance protein D